MIGDKLPRSSGGNDDNVPELRSSASADTGVADPERPWLRNYPAGIPSRIDIPDITLPELLTQTATRYPKRDAIRFLGRSISYQRLNTEVNRYAQALSGLGMRPGDRVALVMPNCPQMVMSIYGGLRAGVVVVPTNPLYVEAEMAFQLRDAGARAVVCLSPFYPLIARVREQLPQIEHIVVTSIKECMPPLKKLLFTLLKERKDGHQMTFPEDSRTHRLQTLLSSSSNRDPRVPVRRGDVAVLQYTGGTTGSAKGAMLSHHNLVANALQAHAWMQSAARPDGGDSVLGVIPLFHSYGLTTVMNFAVANGGTMILQPKFVARDVLKTIQRDRPDLVPGVPTMYAALTAAAAAGNYDLSSLKGGISGAAPLPGEIQRRFEEQTGARIVEGYGLSEASPVTHANPLDGTGKPGTIGVPFPSTDAAIVDPETRSRRLDVGEIGELAVRGPQVMLGYWNLPEESAEVLRDGWLYTGDMARMDADGYFSIVDRKKDMIISGGENVYPRDIEEPLHAHPKVKDVVAVGVPHPRWGEAVKVYIVLKPGENATEQEILDYCRENMAPFRVPKAVEFRTTLPRTLVGKVLRRELVEEERARQETQPSPAA